MTTPNPTLINLPPPPPSDPVTPSDMGPGTPNSGTTSLSALSTTAIKDGHRGQPLPHERHAHRSSSVSMPSTSMLEAERADRISRLAGLERVATTRASGQSQSGIAAPVTQIPGYFDHSGLKERSTVGSASATGSMCGRTTWTSSSDAFDADKMSEGREDGLSSVGNDSDEEFNCVGIGEGASTFSGPTSHPPLSRMSSGNRPRPVSLGSPTINWSDYLVAPLQHGEYQTTSPRTYEFRHYQMVPPPLSPAGSTTPESNTPEPAEDARMVDGMTYDTNVVDTTARTPQLATPYDRYGNSR